MVACLLLAATFAQREESSVLPSDARLLTACPNDCSFHGLCLGDMCECDPGWSGEDCSYPVHAYVSFGLRSLYPLSGLALGGTRVRIKGFNFVNGSSLACRFTPLGTGSMVEVPATYHSSAFVSCLAPPSMLAPPWDPRADEGVPPPPPPPDGTHPDSATPETAASRTPAASLRTPRAAAVSLEGRPLHAALRTPAAEYVVEVAAQPPLFSNNRLRFFQWDAAVTSLTPAGGPLHGATRVVLRGHGLQALTTGEAARCRFGRTHTPATLGADGRSAVCISPPALVPGPVPISVSSHH
jgi:hypothetical protein